MKGLATRHKLFPGGFNTAALAREAEEQDSGNLTQITFRWKTVPPTIDTAWGGPAF